MATPPAPVPPQPLPLSASDFPRLVAAYLPSASSDDDAADAADAAHLPLPPPPLDDDSPDSLDDWSDDRPDSADDYDHTSDSDDSSLAWNTTKVKKHAHAHAHAHAHPHSHSHSHAHAHLHHKKNSFHSACDYLSFFGALRKGFCSRHLDQRIEVYMAHKRVEKSTASGGGDPVPPEKKHKVKSGGHTHKEPEGAASFGVMFKCTVGDTPKSLLKRASFSDNSDEQDIHAHQASAEIMAERDLTETHKKTSGIAELEEVPDLEMVLERDGNGSSNDLTTDGPLLTDSISKDMPHEEYKEAHVDSRPIPLSSKSTLGDEKLSSKEDDQLSNHSNKAPGKRSSGRESDQKGLHGKGNGKHAMPNSSNKSSKNQNQVALVNTLEPKDKGGSSLENNAIQQSKDPQKKTIPPKDDSNESTEMAEIPTSLEKKVIQTKALPDKAKLQDMPLHIYIKEKHPPEVAVKDSRRKTKAKKVKASKGKKLHLFRDGFTLPSATEPVDDAEPTPVLERQSESSNKVQSPTSAVKIKIPREVVSTSATEDMKPPSISKMESNAMEIIGGVPLRDVSEPVVITKTSAAPVHSIKTPAGDPVPSDSDPAVVALPDSIPKAALHASTSFQSVEDGVSKLSLTEGRYAAQPEAKSSIEEYSMRTVVTTVPPPLPKSSRKWFPPLDPALHSPVAAPDPATSLNGSLSAPQSSVGNSLATNTTSYPPTTLLHESEFKPESLGDIQGHLVSMGNIMSSASPNPSSLIEAPLASYHLGNRVPSPAIASSSPRMMDSCNAPYSRYILPGSHSQPFAPNPMSTLSLQQEINPRAFFHVDSRASGNSSWIHPGSHSGQPGYSFPMVPTTTTFGQVIGCVNQTLSLYKQMKSFSIEARYLVNVQSIVPGCCKLFLFNIESRQLHGIYVSSSLQTVSVGHEFPVAFDCLENYLVPLAVEELDTVLPEARHMDGRPLFLQPNTVEQLVTLFERKNKPRLSWVPLTTDAVHGLPGVHGLMEFSAVSSESSATRDRLVEAMGQGPSLISAGPTSMAMIEVAQDSWSPLSGSPRAKVPESGQAFTSHEPDSSASVQAFPFPSSSINNGDGANSVWSDGFTRKLPDKGPAAAPSPMALWPHLFPKAPSPDPRTENLLHMEAREGNSTQPYHTALAEIMDAGARLDSGAESLAFSQVPESAIRSMPLRPKVAYNPLAVEQGRQRHLFEGSKPSSWSTLLPDLDLQPTSQYGNRSRSQDNDFLASLSTSQMSEQPKMNRISGGAVIQSSASSASQLPLHYQMDHALPDALRSDLGLSKIETTPAWSDEPLSNHLPTISPEGATGAANLDQTDICCYCFTRRADHLIIDCQHLGPCLECAASKKIEYCGQLNCQTKVTRLLRLFR